MPRPFNDKTFSGVLTEALARLGCAAAVDGATGRRIKVRDTGLLKGREVVPPGKMVMARNAGGRWVLLLAEGVN